MSINFDAAIADLVAKTQALANGDTTSAEDLVYLAKALEAVGPGSQVLKVALAGADNVEALQSKFSLLESELKNAGDEEKAALNALRIQIEGAVSAAASAEVNRIAGGLLPAGAVIELPESASVDTSRFVEANGQLFSRGVYPALDTLYSRRSMRVGTRRRNPHPTTQGALFSTNSTSCVISGDGLTALYYRTNVRSPIHTIARLYRRTSPTSNFSLVEGFCTDNMNVYMAYHGVEPSITHDGKFIIVGGLNNPVLLSRRADGKYIPSIIGSVSTTGTYNYYGGVLSPCERFWYGLKEYTTTANIFRLDICPFDKVTGEVGTPIQANASTSFHGFSGLTMKSFEMGNFIGLVGMGSANTTIEIAWMNKNNGTFNQRRSFGSTSVDTGGRTEFTTVYDVLPLPDFENHGLFNLLLSTNRGLRLLELEIESGTGLPTANTSMIRTVDGYFNSSTQCLTRSDATGEIFALPSNLVTTPVYRLRLGGDGRLVFISAMPPIATSLLTSSNENRVGEVSKDGQTLVLSGRPQNTNTSSGNEGFVTVVGTNQLELPVINPRGHSNKVYIKAEEI